MRVTVNQPKPMDLRRLHEKLEAKAPPEARRYIDMVSQQHSGRGVGEVNSTKTRFKSRSESTEHVKKLALNLGADLVGVTTLNEAYIFEGAKVPHKFAVSVGVGMDYEEIKTAPNPRAWVEAERVLYKLGEVAIKLADHIRSLGYPARAHHPPWEGSVLHIPLACASGLGELGRHGFFISKQFGSCVRLSTVTTDLPLKVDRYVDHGVDAFCRGCQRCLRMCPVGAIPEGKRRVRGVTRWSIDTDKCVSHVDASGSCLICVSVCPWNKPVKEPRTWSSPPKPGFPETSL